MDRIDEIMLEAVQTSTISRITGAERQEIARLYEKQTGWTMNMNCDSCIIRACFVLNGFNHKENTLNDGKRKKNKKSN